MHYMTTTQELQQQAIQSARDHEWMVCSEGHEYTACVIAWHRSRKTNWCRVMTIVDGIAQTKTEYCSPTVWESGYVSNQLETFKLNTHT